MFATDSPMVSCRRTAWQVYLVVVVVLGCAAHGFLLRAELSRVASALSRCHCV